MSTTDRELAKLGASFGTRFDETEFGTVGAEALSSQIPNHHIESNQHTCVTKVAVVIGSNTAHIDPNIFSIYRGKFFFSLGERIVDFHAVATDWTMNHAE